MADKKKLFFIIHRLVIGGHLMDTLSMAYYLSGKYEVTVVYGEKEKDEMEMPFFIQTYPSISFLKLSSLHRSVLPWQDVMAYRKLLAILKKSKPDVVHTHGFKSGFLGRIAAHKAKVPVIIHTYHGHLFHSYYNRFISSFIIRIERRLAKLSTHIVAISPQQAYELNNVYRIAPKEKTSIVFLGIDKESYEASLTDSSLHLRKKYSVRDDAVVIAIIGRIVKIKNHLLFVHVAEKALKQQENFYFFVIGDGSEKKFIQAELDKHSLTWQEGETTNQPARIIFTSWITDIAPALREIDIVMLTSLNEGTPVSLIEAQLLEKPVVSTNVGGVKDTIINNETGFLIDDFSVECFVKKLSLLASDKSLREQMGKAGMAFAAERFSKRKEVAAIDHLYTVCLQQQKYPS